jgi:hypothetical protein
MAVVTNAITWADKQGEYSYEYRLLAENMIDALYTDAVLVRTTKQRSIANFASNAERFPFPPKIAAAALTEGEDLAVATAFVPTAVTLTVGEVGLKLTITDLQSMAQIVDIGHYGREAGKAIAEKLNDDIAALFAAFTQTAAAAAYSDGAWLAAIAALKAADVPGPYVSVFDPFVWYTKVLPLIGGGVSPLANTGASARQEANDLTRNDNGFAGQFFGTDVYITSSIVDSGTYRNCAVYSPNRAIGMVEKWAIRPEMERDASLRGDEIVVTAAYAVGELDDTSGYLLKVNEA